MRRETRAWLTGVVLAVIVGAIMLVGLAAFWWWQYDSSFLPPRWFG